MDGAHDLSGSLVGECEVRVGSKRSNISNMRVIVPPVELRGSY